MFKKTLMAAAVVAAFSTAGGAFAADAAPAEAKSPHTLTGNAGIFSQYIFRGLKQTNGKPAFQGGFDYAHESGFYAGTWMSNVSWLKENQTSIQNKVLQEGGTYGGGGSLEADFYGGYKLGLAEDVTLDLGTLYYYYPGTLNPVVTAGIPTLANADTWEIYVAPSWKWLSAKYSYSVKSSTFGTRDSKGTSYLDISANYPIEDTGITLMAHWGWQKYKGTDSNNAILNGAVMSNDAAFSYKDIKVGLSYTLPKDFTVGAYYTKALSYSKVGYGSALDCATGKPGAGGVCGVYPSDIGAGTATVYLQKTF